MRIRAARPEDLDAIAAFTQETWDRYDDGDYIARIFPKWAVEQGPKKKTFVAEAAGQPIGLIRSVKLSAHEAWFQGLRVDPEHRNEGVGEALVHTAFEWAQEAGATVGRAMVFSWNVMGLGLTRAAGFEPGVEFRFAHPVPDSTAEVAGSVSDAPDRAWSFWHASAHRDRLQGLCLDQEVPWSLSELTRGDLRQIAASESLVTIERDRVVAMAPRIRVTDRGPAEDTIWAEYGAAAWRDEAAAGDLMAAIARDAAAAGADRTRVLIPETPAAVTAVAANRFELAEEPHFIVRVDLTRDSFS
jgi:GNAT superfamily N-acetyltransferase